MVINKAGQQKWNNEKKPESTGHLGDGPEAHLVVKPTREEIPNSMDTSQAPNLVVNPGEAS